MSDTFIIEVSSQPAGIVVRGPGGFQFFAASHRFNRLNITQVNQVKLFFYRW